MAEVLGSWSAAGVALIVVLAVCFVVEIGLVVTLPAVMNCFRRLLHFKPVVARPTTT